MKTEKVEGDSVYNLIKWQLEKQDKGKIVAIDIDAKKIISKDFDKNKVLLAVRCAESSGRIHIRRVSEDGNTGIEIY